MPKKVVAPSLDEKKKRLTSFLDDCQRMRAGTEAELGHQPAKLSLPATKEQTPVLAATTTPCTAEFTSLQHFGYVALPEDGEIKHLRVEVLLDPTNALPCGDTFLFNIDIEVQKST